MESTLETREDKYLDILRKKSKRRHFGKEVSQKRTVFTHGSMLCYEKEFMIIVSEGNIGPSGVTLAKRQVNDTVMKQALNNYEELQSVLPDFQGVSQSTAFDLKIITHKISCSELIHLSSLKLDIPGEERPKAY